MIASPHSSAIDNDRHPEGNQLEMTLNVFQSSFWLRRKQNKTKKTHSGVGGSKHLLKQSTKRKDVISIVSFPNLSLRSTWQPSRQMSS